MTAATSFPLFGKSEAHEIARTIRDDWAKFSAVAFIALGLTAVWDAALIELDLTEQAFVRDSLDLDILTPVFDLMVVRLGVLPDRMERFERLMGALAIPAPRIVARVKEEMAMTQEQFRRREYQAWSAGCRAIADAERKDRWAKQSSASVQASTLLRR